MTMKSHKEQTTYKAPKEGIQPFQTIYNQTTHLNINMCYRTV